MTTNFFFEFEPIGSSGLQVSCFFRFLGFTTTQIGFTGICSVHVYEFNGFFGFLVYWFTG